jgi:hypothetical protein
VSHHLLAVAKLGGYLVRTKDPPPGNMVVWWGLTGLVDLVLGAELDTAGCGELQDPPDAYTRTRGEVGVWEEGRERLRGRKSCVRLGELRFGIFLNYRRNRRLLSDFLSVFGTSVVL